MSLAIMLALEVSPMSGDGKMITIARGDTAVNPTPDDWDAEFLLAESMVDRLLDDIKKEAHERFREYREAMVNVERDNP